MKIYTKTGDAGETGLLGGSRVLKSHARINAIGSVDEANAAFGLVTGSEQLMDSIQWIQGRLFDIGAELASPPNSRVSSALLTPEATQRLEAEIDGMVAKLPPLTAFILPGGTPTARGLHLARSVTRRAERDMVALAESRESQLRPDLIAFVNRLSDWTFTAARWANFEAGVAEVPWKGEGKA